MVGRVIVAGLEDETNADKWGEMSNDWNRNK